MKQINFAWILVVALLCLAYGACLGVWYGWQWGMKDCMQKGYDRQPANVVFVSDNAYCNITGTSNFTSLVGWLE